MGKIIFICIENKVERKKKNSSDKNVVIILKNKYINIIYLF